MSDKHANPVHVTHGFGPVYDAGSHTLILGSFPSVKSREAAFFYGNPQNRFWRVLAILLDEPALAGETMAPARPESPAEAFSWMSAEDIAEKREILLSHGIALWDVIESCDIEGSSDASIRNVEPVDISRILRVAPIRSVFANGGTAARLYHQHLEETVGIAAISLPSSSPANASYSLDRLVAAWREAGVGDGC